MRELARKWSWYPDFSMNPLLSALPGTLSLPAVAVSDSGASLGSTG